MILKIIILYCYIVKRLKWEKQRAQDTRAKGIYDSFLYIMPYIWKINIQELLFNNILYVLTGLCESQEQMHKLKEGSLVINLFWGFVLFCC